MQKLSINALLIFVNIFLFSFTAAGQRPMSCRIHGQILSVIKSKEKDSTSICAKHPCKAKVRIIGISACGQGVSWILNQGDEVEMDFAYTLHNTSKILPAMKAQYPGLKKGDEFTAPAMYHLKPGTNGAFTVYEYDKIVRQKSN